MIVIQSNVFHSIETYGVLNFIKGDVTGCCCPSRKELTLGVINKISSL